MRSGRRQNKVAMVLALALPMATAVMVGCREEESGKYLKQVDLTANQLAAMLDIDVWAFQYSGGAVECWLEITETGQKTMPVRMPDQGYLGQGVVDKPAEGTILLWWTKNPADSSGVLHFKMPNMNLQEAIEPGGFTFGWKGVKVAGTESGKAKAVQGTPGAEVVLIEYNAEEAIANPGKGQAGSGRVPRSVRLKLKARFAPK
jgi:hypothetical protein